MQAYSKSVQDEDLKPVWIGIFVALILWAFMFRVNYGNFWGWMVIATSALSLYSFYHDRDILKSNWSWSKILLWGIGSAVILYAIFVVGDMVTQSFANQDQQIDSIYGRKSQLPHWVIGALLVFPIGPGEEIFWRGFVQKRLAKKWNPWIGFLIAGLAYTAVHIPSMNLMLVGAAGVCGVFWGLLYKITGSVLPGIVSHAVWDISIFVLFPVQ